MREPSILVDFVDRVNFFATLALDCTRDRRILGHHASHRGIDQIPSSKTNSWPFFSPPWWNMRISRRSGRAAHDEFDVLSIGLFDITDIDSPAGR